MSNPVIPGDAGFIVMAIGCLECHEPTDLWGVFATLEEAKAAFPKATLRGSPKDDGETSSNDYLWIFDLSKPTPLLGQSQPRRPADV